MRRKRILFIDIGSDYGGVEIYLKNLGTLLGPHAEGFAVLSLPRLAAELRAQGMIVVCLPILGLRWLKAVRLVLAAMVVPCMMLRYRIRTVQVNGFFESLLLGPLRICGANTIFTMHNPFQTDLYSWFRSPERWVPRFLSKHSLRFASQIVCVSEAVAAQAREALPAGKITVIANWVAAPDETRKKFLETGSGQLLFVGRLEEYKGVQFILEAMRGLPNLSLVVVGEGSYRKQLQAEAAGLNVHFAGFQSDPSIFYKDATLFINPSLGPEGLPLVSLEAMACGLPCIFSDLPVHLEISAGGEAAAHFQAWRQPKPGPSTQALTWERGTTAKIQPGRAACGGAAL